MKLKEHIRIYCRGLRQFYSYAPRYFISHSIGDFLSAVTPYVPVYFSAKLIDALAAGESVGTLAWYAGLTVGLTFLLHLISRYLSAVDSKTSNDIHRQEQWAYSEKAMSMAYESIEDRDTALLKARIAKESQFGYNMWYLRSCFSQFIFSFTKIATSLILSVSFFTMNSIPLSMKLGLVAVLVLTIVSNILTTSKVSKLFNDFYSSDTSVGLNILIEKFNDYVMHYSSGKDIRLYGMGDGLAKRIADFNGNWYYEEIKVSNRAALIRIPMKIIESLLQLTLYTVLIYGALKGEVSVGSIAKYVSCVTMLLSAVTTLIRSVQTTLLNNTFLERYFSYFDIPNNMYQGSLTVEKRDDREYYVEFRNVSFKYPNSDTYALKNVNLKFKVGEKLAVVGENSSGKTTFIKLMCRLYDPTEGEILLNGVDIRKYEYNEYMSIFSVVFQDFRLFAFTLGQNVAASSKYDEERVKLCLEQAGFGDRVAEMPDGIETYLYRDFDDSGVEISGGESQKIAIARALYKDAPFIILDEPTAALDPLAEYEVYSKFNEIAGDRTSIYISHRLASCRFCDRIAVFDSGRVVQFGTHDELVADEKGKYHELWHAQAQYYTEKTA